MLKNVSELKKEVFVSINNELYKPTFSNYNEIFEDCILNSHQEFIEKYEIKYSSTIQDFHLITIYHYKTFDGGEIEIELHKFDGDYDFKYNIKKESKQIQQIQEEFEPSWINDELAVQLF